MAVYGPSTGHFSSGSISAARKTGGKGGSKLSKDSNGRYTVYTPDSSGLEDRYQDNSNGSSYYNTYQRMLDSQRSAQEEAIRRQTEATINKINSYRPQVEQSYAEQQKQNYIASAQNQNQMGDYLNAMGYTGGMAESTMAQVNNTYQNNRNAADKEKNNAMAQIDQQVAQARSTGDASLANATSDYYNKYLSMLQNQEQMNLQKQASDKQSQIETMGQYSNDFMAQINKLENDGDPSNDWQIPYLTMYRNEKMAGQEEAKAKAEQQALENYWKQQQVNYQVNKPYYKPGGGGGSSQKPSYSALVKLRAMGMISEEEYQQRLMSLI